MLMNIVVRTNIAVRLTVTTASKKKSLKKELNFCIKISLSLSCSVLDEVLGEVFWPKVVQCSRIKIYKLASITFQGYNNPASLCVERIPGHLVDTYKLMSVDSD